MPDNSIVKKVYEWSPALTRSLGRPKNRWDDVKSDITRMKINWKDCIRNRTKWKKLVEKAKTSLKLLRLKKRKKKYIAKDGKQLATTCFGLCNGHHQVMMAVTKAETCSC